MKPMSTSVSYVLITPARNEERNIERVIQSVVNQTVTPRRWVIVNDGSSDRTADLVRPFLETFDWIELLEMPHHRDRSFGAKAHCFNAAYRRVEGLQFDVIGNLDADLSFDPDYLEFLMARFAEDRELGVAGTIFKEDGYSSETDSFEGHSHVAGGCQLFRRQCFEQIGGYVPTKIGLDWIAVTTARMKGWKTRSFREKAFFHHRSLGTGDRSRLAAAFLYGEKDYRLGWHPLWQLFRVAYRSTRRPLVGLCYGLGYVTAFVRQIEKPVSPELQAFHRREQMVKLRAILKSVVTLKRIDSFQVMPR
jgi:glycosyltransferase involved in cell wall biosynthesis